MLEERGVVVAINDKFAIVQTKRMSYCTRCVANKGCSTASLASVLGQKYTEVKVVNHEGVKVGEQVVIGLEEIALLKGSLALYLLPLLSMFACTIGYDMLATLIQWSNSEILTVLAGLFGLFIGLIWARRVTVKMFEKAHYQPVILKTDL